MCRLYHTKDSGARFVFPSSCVGQKSSRDWLRRLSGRGVKDGAQRVIDSVPVSSSRWWEEEAVVPESGISPAPSPQMAARANISGCDACAGYRGPSYSAGNRKEPRVTSFPRGEGGPAPRTVGGSGWASPKGNVDVIRQQGGIKPQATRGAGGGKTGRSAVSSNKKVVFRPRSPSRGAASKGADAPRGRQREREKSKLLWGGVVLVPAPARHVSGMGCC